MSRKVGNFTCSSTGETHWLEPNTAKLYTLTPTKPNEYGRIDKDNFIDYALDNIDELRVITLNATYKAGNGKKYHSQEVHMDELLFAEALFEASEGNGNVTDKGVVQEAINAANYDISSQCYADGILLGELNLRGGGYVYSNDDKVITIEELEFKVTARGIEFTLIDCVGHLLLENVVNPSVVFYSNDRLFTIENFEIVESITGILSKYKITSSSVALERSDDPIEFDNIYREKHPEYDSEFVRNRVSYLSSVEIEEEDIIDDRFADLF